MQIDMDGTYLRLVVGYVTTTFAIITATLRSLTGTEHTVIFV
jgi:hypothetical protein